jgi:DNA-binding transcriptional LysR family regulator
MKQFQIFDIIVEVGKCGSIRKAAERLFITPSALTRKIQDFESEFGRPIFERLPSGMRLNAAGDLLLKYIQMHRADYGALLAEVSELDGVRRGHISIACAQAFIDNLLPDQISLYRAKFPGVTFTVDVRDNHLGISALENYQADLALLIDPPFNADIQEFFVRNQPICAVVSILLPTDQRIA